MVITHLQGENMKLAKLSLAAIVVAGLTSSSFAADTLADAFKNGTVNGELKAYYFSKDDGKKTEDLFTTGATLGYKTASLYGLSLGLTFQGNSSPFADGAVNDTESLRTGEKVCSKVVSMAQVHNSLKHT